MPFHCSKEDYTLKADLKSAYELVECYSGPLCNSSGFFPQAFMYS